MLHSLRHIATHAGQLDAARELIDGKLDVVLTHLPKGRRVGSSSYQEA